MHWNEGTYYEDASESIQDEGLNSVVADSGDGASVLDDGINSALGESGDSGGTVNANELMVNITAQSLGMSSESGTTRSEV